MRRRWLSRRGQAVQCTTLLSGSGLGIVVGGIGGAVMIAFTVGFLYPLKILVSFLQAFIFVMLSMLYISGAVEEAEHHGGEHHPAHH